MIIKQYFPGANRKSMEEELFKACYACPVGETIPTLFYFQGCVESKLFHFMYPAKLAKEVHRNVHVFADRGWNAVVYMDEIGLIHVFFGENEGELELPEVFNSPVQGRC